MNATQVATDYDTTRFWTIPNCITVFRMSVGWIVGLALAHTAIHQPFDAIGLWGWIIILIILCLSDTLDGKLARAIHQRSTWGKALDPLSDKVFFYPIVFALMFRTLPHYVVQSGPTSTSWILSLVIAPLFVMDCRSTWGYLVDFYHGRSRGANGSGKNKTVVCMTTLCVCYAMLAIDTNHRATWGPFVALLAGIIWASMLSFQSLAAKKTLRV